MIFKPRWRLYVLSVSFPIIALLPAGFYWLWLNNLLLWWFGVSAILALCAWGVNYFVKRKQKEPVWLDISDKVLKTQESDIACRRVEAISKKIRNSDPDLSDIYFYLESSMQVINAVATVYFPQQKQAVLEIKIPYLLKVIEMLTQDLRVSLTENVPGSHLFSLNDLIKGRNIANKSQGLYRLVRLISLGYDPVSSLVRELRLFTTSSILTESTQEMKSWLIDAYIKKIGFYAIELYSGNISLDDEEISKASSKTRQEIYTLQQREKKISAEPFRILILGQGNAGKASLVNAIANKQLALADVEPNPLFQQTYFIRSSDYSSAIIANTFRYDEVQYRQDRNKLLEQAASNDVIILVISANNPAYRIDKIVLDDLKKMSGSVKIAVIVTHVDKLRPLREWSPPYNLLSVNSAKAVSINQAVELIATEIVFDRELMVPISFRKDLPFNYQEQLLPLLQQLFKLTENRRYLRGLHASKRDIKKKKLLRQLYKTSSSVSRLGLNLFDKRKHWTQNKS